MKLDTDEDYQHKYPKESINKELGWFSVSMPPSSILTGITCLRKGSKWSFISPNSLESNVHVMGSLRHLINYKVPEKNSELDKEAGATKGTLKAGPIKEVKIIDRTEKSIGEYDEIDLKNGVSMRIKQRRGLMSSILKLDYPLKHLSNIQTNKY